MVFFLLLIDFFYTILNFGQFTTDLLSFSVLIWSLPLISNTLLKTSSYLVFLFGYFVLGFLLFANYQIEDGSMELGPIVTRTSFGYLCAYIYFFISVTTANRFVVGITSLLALVSIGVNPARGPAIIFLLVILLNYAMWLITLSQIIIICILFYFLFVTAPSLQNLGSVLYRMTCYESLPSFLMDYPLGAGSNGFQNHIKQYSSLDLSYVSSSVLAADRTWVWITYRYGLLGLSWLIVFFYRLFQVDRTGVLWLVVLVHSLFDEMFGGLLIFPMILALFYENSVRESHRSF